MKNWKTFALLGMMIVTAAAVYIAFHYKSVADHKPDISDKTKAIIQADATILARRVDKEGIESVTIKEAENLIPRGAWDRVALSPGIADTTAKAIARANILEKQLQSLMIVNSSLVAENLKAKEVINVQGAKAYAYKDKFVDLQYTPPSATDTASRGVFNFAYNADLNIVQYWKRNWFLGAKHSYIDIYSNDPRTKVNGVKRLVYEQKQPTFGLRVQGTVNYNPQTGSVGFGPAARFDAGRVSVQGNYTWYPESGRWRPSVNANFDLIRF